ncbi:TetR/AcrR family transcriptional regulator [Lysinibacter sp. HNR]|uniref:TetR/AcrR family transcriptional regulator n=1 Tax=Lysinibacter sp. HNR TaxID=3031408 RepID=UPI0024356246|nr:TetR/AcrR family transcriptional regulator [Lysinibacter sp. HNR]WGD37368.1 TetR/AcrR family transcriptional regulator [Lysinibacter sp. HNR]
MTRRSRAQMLDETHGLLVGAAREFFGRFGYAATSMDDLTASVGLTRGALYHHFAGKSGLLVGVVKAIDAELCNRLGVVSARYDDPLTALAKRSRAYLELTQAADMQQILFKDAPAVLPEVTEASVNSCLASLETLFEQARGKGLLPAGASPRTLAMLLTGALRDASQWIAAASDTERTERLSEAASAAALFVEGLRQNH